MKSKVLIDTGPLVAILAHNDSRHSVCTEALRNLTPPLYTCWPVITEVAWLLRKQPSAIESLFDSFKAGLFEMLLLETNAVSHVAVLLRRYQDLGVQLADICLVHLAQRESIDTIFTLDRRDFTVYRYRGQWAFHLLP